MAARSLSLVVALPLVLRDFTTAEVALWQVLATFITLQTVAEAGFGVTITRFASYAMGGERDFARIAGVRRTRPDAKQDWAALASILAAARSIYGWLTLALVVALGAGGSWVVNGRLSALEAGARTSGAEAWVAWLVVLVGSAINLYYNHQSALLLGAGSLPVVRRWEACTGLAASLASIGVLLAQRGVLELILANQIWVVVVVIRNKLLIRRLLSRPAATLADSVSMIQTRRGLFAQAWRSGLGVLMSMGVTNVISLVYAGAGATADVASYFLALRLLNLLSQFAQAPFYARLPEMGQMYAGGAADQLLAQARRGMSLSLLTFAGGFACLTMTGPAGVTYLGSQTTLPSFGIWATLGVAMLLERYGAMHLQLYTLSGHVVWHIANGVGGLVTIAVVALGYRPLGAIALPLGLLAGVMGWYFWYSTLHSYRRFKLSFRRFDARIATAPVTIMAGTLLFAWNLAH